MNKRYAVKLRITFAALSAALLSISALEAMPKRIIWNASPSVPIGLYWVKNDMPKKGDIVIVDLPEPFKSFADQRDYLPRNVPALKRLRAVSGDIICRMERKILINGKIVSVAQLRDYRGLTLPRWSGCHILKPDEVFLLNDHPKSFDGRYIGAVNRNMVTGIAVPIWTD